MVIQFSKFMEKYTRGSSPKSGEPSGEPSVEQTREIPAAQASRKADNEKPANASGNVMADLDRTLFSPAENAPVERFLNDNVATDRGRDALQTIASDPQGDGADIVNTLAERDVTVSEGNTLEEAGALGLFDPETNEISVDPDLNDDDYLRTLVHEGLHAGSDRFGNSKYEEGLNNVIADQIASRVTGSEPESAVKTFSETARLYPGLPVTNPFNESLSETGIDVKDYVGFSGFLDNFRTDRSANADSPQTTRIRNANLVIEGSDGPEDIRGAVETSIVTAVTGAGDDIVDLSATGSAVTLDAGEDNDATRLALDGGSAALVDAGSGSDFTVVEASENSAVSVNANDGNDFTVVGASNSLVNVTGGEGFDTTVAQGENNRLNVDAGAGSDLTEITQTNSQVTVDAGAGDDETLLFTEGGETVLNSGAGNDATFAVTTDSTTTINGGQGNDAAGITAFGGKSTITGGQGDDLAVAITQDSETVIRGGEGNDSAGVTAFGGKTTVNGGQGDDFTLAITQDSETTLRGGQGNDTTTVTAFGGKTTVDGGEGDDIITAVTDNSETIVRGGRGNDIVDITATGGTTVVNGGAGADTLNIAATDSEVTVNGGEGDDYIVISNTTGSRFVISTGGGRDTIVIGENVQNSSFSLDESTADDEIIFAAAPRLNFGPALSLSA